MKFTAMVFLAALTGVGVTGCIDSASLPASQTVKSSDGSVALVASNQANTADFGTQQGSAETNSGNSVVNNLQLASGSSNPWKPKVNERKWKYLVLHHTASQTGSVKSIDAAHKQRKDAAGNPWLGIGYHFVIGNGKGMKDGEIQPTFRWTKQIHGAHAGVSAYNELGIGIVLVGNFDQNRPTNAQLASAKRLVKTLRSSYRINAKNIVTHGDVNKTACPGKYFSLARITRAGDPPVLGDSSSTGLPLTFADRREVQ